MLLPRLEGHRFLLEEKVQGEARLSQRIVGRAQAISDRGMTLVIEGQLKIAPAPDGLQGHAEALKRQNFLRLNERLDRGCQDRRLLLADRRGSRRGREAKLDIA